MPCPDLGAAMRRREFITLAGGAVAWPLAARAQQPERMRRIGVLLPGTANDAEYQARMVAFLQGLQQLGWSEGRNVRIDTRWAAGDANLIRKYVAELIALAPDVILAPGNTTVGPLLQATRAVPIVFTTLLDPVGAGFVEKPGAARWQRHRFHRVRIWPEREMAGTAQADRAKPDASGDPSGSNHSCRDRPVCRNPVRGAVAQCGGQPGQHA